MDEQFGANYVSSFLMDLLNGNPNVYPWEK